MRRPSAVRERCLLALLVITAVSCEDPRAALVRGRIGSVKGNEIAIVPLEPHRSARPLTLTIDQQKTTILARRVESGTMNLERAGRSDLVVGHEVAVTIYGRQASIIRVFPPKPVGGRVAGVNGRRLTIALDNEDPNRLNATAQFLMTDQTKVLLKTIEATALAPANVEELKPGRRVFVYAQGADVVAVKIVPEPAVVGSVVRIGGDSIVIRRPFKGGGTADFTIPYRPNSARAIVQYFGTDVTAPAALSDIKPGARAAVYVGEGGTVAIKFVSTPLRGRLLAVDANSITVQADDGSTWSQQYRIVPAKTTVTVPSRMERARPADGRSREGFTFGAGTFNDLRAGEPIILSAANDLAVAVRVMPMPATRPQNSLALTKGPPQ